MKKELLLVDDDAVISSAIQTYFEAKGYDVRTAATVAEAQIAFRSKRPDVAVVDYQLPDGDALQLLERFKAIDPSCPVIVLTGNTSIDLAVRAIQEGASHFLTKPVKLPALETVVERALESEVMHRHELARRVTGGRVRLDPFAGPSAAIRELGTRARKILNAESPVLIMGETGTGKGVLARWLHENGPRKREPFVDLNCAGLTREFLDTELFGHEKGAFTGAIAAKQGLFDVAHGGTLFLDEIGDVDPQIQPKLLKVLEEKRFRRLGDVNDRTVDVRLIGATHHDLESMSADGRFRSDLFFRINTLTLRLPPLRERPDDIPLLAAQILAHLALTSSRRDVRVSDEAMKSLQAYAWPGNVRELRNVLERALLFAEGNVLLPADLSLTFRGAPLNGAFDDLSLTLEQVERNHIVRVLEAEHGYVERAAARLGVPRSSLYQKIKRYGIPVHRSEIQTVSPGTG
jgi:DNA-binding NtrC family response regulator